MRIVDASFFTTEKLWYSCEFDDIGLTSVALSPSRTGCWSTQWSSTFHRSEAAGWRNGWRAAFWSISTASPRSLVCPAHTHTHTAEESHHLRSFCEVWQTESTTNLLDLESLHERHKLEEEAGQAEQEVDELVDNQRPPGGDLELGVVVQHVAPGMLQWGLEGVLWQHGVHVLHRQVGWAQDVCRTVHLHVVRPGMPEKKTVSSGQPDRRCLLDWLYNQAPNWILFWLYG